MTELLNNLDAPSDAELISRVRAGDVEAYGDLYARHVDAARRLARQLVRGPDSEDLVSDAFAKVMGVLQGGGGPDVAFRAYLLTAVRRLHVDRIRSQSRVQTSDDMTAFDPGVPFHDTALEQFESGAAAKAFASLPERWQLVLWHLEVEGQKPADIAPLLGMSANSVSALAYRAREGLRQAYLTAHLADINDTDCRWVTEHLGGYVRKGLSRRDATKVEAHLDDCRSCTGMYLELTEVNSNLSAIIAPLLLGGLAAGYVATGAAGGASAGGIVLLLGRAKDFVAANLVPVAAGTAAAGVAAVTAVAIAISSGGDKNVADPAPAPSLSSPATSPTSAPPSTSPSATRTPAPRTVVSPTPTVSAFVPVVLPPPSETAAASATPTDQPTQDPTEDPTDPPRTPVANIRIGSATVSDDALVLDLAGLPDTPVSVEVTLSSASGRTAFVPSTGACTVRAATPTRATCVTTAAAARQGVFRLAPDSFQAVIPLDFPADLDSDQLDVDVAIDGYDDSDASDNRVSFVYTPVRSTPTGTGTPTATDTPTETPTDTGTPTPTDTGSPTPTDTGSPTPTDTGSPTPTDTGSPTPTDTGSPTPTDTGSPTAAPGSDLALTLNDNALGQGIGRFRAQVTGMPGGGLPLHFAFFVSDPRVDIEAVPTGCHISNEARTVVDCVKGGATFNGIFDMNLRRIDPDDVVTVRVGVSSPGNDDPDLTNNVRSVTMNQSGIISVDPVLGRLVRLLGGVL